MDYPMNQKHPIFKDGALDEYSEAWRRVIDKIDHIFVNKLALLRSKNNDIHKILPKLLEGYRLAIEHKLILSESEQLLDEDLCNAFDLKSEIEPWFNTLDAVHAFCEELFNIDTSNRLQSAKNYIDKMLNTYEFKSGERDLIRFNGDLDFNFSFSEFFLNAALTEFFKFTFNRFKASQQKKIEIYFSCEDGRNAIHFNLVCPEVAQNYQHFFENSLSTINNRLVPGINFCRLALLKGGGDICYSATEGQKLAFLIVFPSIPT